MRDKPIPLELIQQWLQAAPLATVNIVVTDNDEVLLVKRRSEPAKNQWFTPGGILIKGDTIIQQAANIVKAETSVESVPYHVLGVYDELWEEGYGVKNVHLITIIVKAEAQGGQTPAVDEEHEEAKWFKIRELPKDLPKLVVTWIKRACPLYFKQLDDAPEALKEKD